MRLWALVGDPKYGRLIWVPCYVTFSTLYTRVRGPYEGPMAPTLDVGIRAYRL